jgi:CheY-like chemotaxis protein
MHEPPLILIADDDADFLQILASKLKASGFWVAEASSGDDAVEKAENLVPDLIILDINMPRGNGTEALVDLKKSPTTQNIKTLFLSSLATPWPMIKKERPEFSKELGAEDFIDKSEDLDKTVEKIKTTLGVSLSPPPQS